MKLKIGASMRLADMGTEKRDSLSRDWSRNLDHFADSVDWVPLPNLGARTVELARNLDLQGLLLTGGDDIGMDTLRDQSEIALLDWARESKIPVLGICRGMQMLCHYAGTSVHPGQDTSHRATEHTVLWRNGLGEVAQVGEQWRVNSFHNNLILSVPDGYEVLATAPDESLEAIRHLELPWLGVVWHPERTSPRPAQQLDLLHHFFQLCQSGRPKSLGAVYWFTGLAGSGKTTLGKAFVRLLESLQHQVTYLDGDILRPVLAEDLGYSSQERFRAASRYARLCKLLADQRQTVVCATISMFDSVRDWNRANIPQYREIFVQASQQELLKRNQKDLYFSPENPASQVVGVDLAAEFPKSPDLVINNSGAQSPEEIARQIFEQFPP